MPTATAAVSARLALARAFALTRFEWACTALIGLGFASRLHMFQIRGLTWDVGWYMGMGVSLNRWGEFLVPWRGADVYTQNYPPMYPTLLAGAFKIMGVSITTLHVVATLVTLFLLAVTFLATRDLFGRSRAFATTAVVAVFPVLVKIDIHGFTESLVVAFFALTIWGILKGLDDPRYMLAAGLFAALGYLTKASMGAFFILAGAGGFLWRFYYMRWRVLRDPWYIGAGAILGAAILLWGGRNVLRHGWPNWQTQKHASDAFHHMWTQPEWPLVLGGQFVWSAFILVTFMAAFWWGIRTSLPRIREEATSGLWLAVLTPSFIAVFFVTAFHMIEEHGSIMNTLNTRYLVTPLVPILWLAFRDIDFDGPRADEGRASRVLTWTGVGVVAATLALDPTRLAITLPRVAVLFGGCAAGAALVAAGVLARKRAAVRKSGGETTTRLVPDDTAGKAALGLAAVALVGLVIAWNWALPFLPFYLGAAFALALRDPRAKVAAVAVVFLGASLAGGGTLGDEERMAADLVAAGATTVGALHHEEHFFWAYLPESVTMTLTSANPDYIVDIYPENMTRVNSPPDGYAVWRTYEGVTFRAPGTAVVTWFEESVLGHEPIRPSVPFATVYARAG